MDYVIQFDTQSIKEVRNQHKDVIKSKQIFSVSNRNSVRFSVPNLKNVQIVHRRNIAVSPNISEIRMMLQF